FAGRRLWRSSPTWATRPPAGHRSFWGGIRPPQSVLTFSIRYSEQQVNNMIPTPPGIRKPLDPLDSGNLRRSRTGTYLAALATITDEMSLKERSNLIFLDRCLHEHWGLGQNVILNWCPEGDGISLLIIPHYGVAEYSTETKDQGVEPRSAPAAAVKP